MYVLSLHKSMKPCGLTKAMRFVSINYCFAKNQKIIEPSQTNASINYSEDKKYIYISGQGFEYRFNKSAALFDKLNYQSSSINRKTDGIQRI